ncbi:hypothetical protein B0T26DRAFT_608788, partial [Lasiosphaeria miniovina]
ATSTVPEDAAKPNIIPSVARPDQQGGPDTSGLGQMADNGVGATGMGEVVGAAGGEIPADIGGKYSRSGGKERGQPGAPHGGRNQPSH